MEKNNNEINQEKGIILSAIQNILKNNINSINQTYKNFILRELTTCIYNWDGTFPDFLSPAGFIEVFYVTSYFENKKGSIIHRYYNDIINDKRQMIRQKIDFTTYEIYSNDGHSIDNLRTSILSNINTHLKNYLSWYKNSPYNKNKKSIFLIYYRDFVIQEKINIIYKISGDNNLLLKIKNLLLSFKIKHGFNLDYILFLTNQDLTILYINDLLNKNISSGKEKEYLVKTVIVKSNLISSFKKSDNETIKLYKWENKNTQIKKLNLEVK